MSIFVITNFFMDFYGINTIEELYFQDATWFKISLFYKVIYILFS